MPYQILCESDGDIYFQDQIRNGENKIKLVVTSNSRTQQMH